DEKYVTERAYSRPRFVEDLVREVGTRLKAQPAFPRFEVSAESFESIRAHSAYARFSYPPQEEPGFAGVASRGGRRPQHPTEEPALPASPVAEARRPRHRIGKS
ncbi:MAG: GTP cyclohydrolase, FolE2/MptA family, partial [Myxococcales bacterium]